MDKFKEKNPLSLRERQVLRMLAQGDEYSQISHNLNISINTVNINKHSKVSCEKHQT